MDSYPLSPDETAHAQNGVLKSRFLVVGRLLILLVTIRRVEHR